MEYNFREREKYWQKYWAEKKTFRAESNSTKEKYYVLDMFPYPSGAGLHVGHPLGYIASDIVARYQRALGKNVLHPMGYDSFGLPAEQYAIQTGQHPAITTEQNIARYREQLDNIGFSFDWDREVRTSNSDYYKWTQWIFMQIFNSWYNKKSDKAESIETLIQEFEINGNANINAVCDDTATFNAAEWKSKSEEEQQRILLNYRLTYLADTWVNWCPQLGTVLANEEVKDGVSERGGYPVERKLMKQWSMRITAYAERLLQGLENIDWSESIKESQRNWIGKSEGSSLKFGLSPNPSPKERGAETPEKQSTLTGSAKSPLRGDLEGLYIEVFTTRPDTIFGVTFLTLAPEHELVSKITTSEYKAAVDEYVTYAKNRSERDRMSEVKKITGQFTGAYAVHPFNNTLIPIWIGDYVLAGYGTGAVMAVPAGDQRDYDFAKHFNLPIIPIVKDADSPNPSLPKGEGESLTPNPPPKERGAETQEKKSVNENVGSASEASPMGRFGGALEGANPTKDGVMINSSFLDGLTCREAMKLAIQEIEKMGIGKGKINYRLRDAIFSRQRYWGEPIPVYFKNDIPYLIDEKDLPLVLPEVDKYLPTETGEPPLARADNWTYKPSSPTPNHSATISQNPKGDGVAEPVKFGWKTAANSTYEELKERSRNLRNNPTESEAIIWKFISDEQLGFKIRRQHIIGNNIVDFVCLDRKLIIEIDGKIHDNQQEYDAARTQELESIGFSVIRFENAEIIAQPEIVAEKIKIALIQKVLPFGEDLGGADCFPLEKSTMPGWAGSSWYFFRYMDAQNPNEFASKEATKYWNQVDLYLGGSEHATGHLLYCRFWTKFLNDRGYLNFDEPAKKLINQGMIQGVSSFAISVHNANIEGRIVSFDEINFKDSKLNSDDFLFTEIINHRIPYALVDFEGNECRIYKKNISLRNHLFAGFPLIFHDQSKHVHWKKTNEGEEYLVLKTEVEKMSKSKWNVVNPDDIVEKYGADCLRLYEMFLGPLELSKPWNTNGITGVSGFLKKFWRLFTTSGKFEVSNEAATKQELKVLHRTIKKVKEDIERFSFNTSVSTFMICTNELTDLKCNKREILEPLTIILAPYAPHIAEEVWKNLGHETSITFAAFPICNESYLVESSFEYPISINGKTKFNLELELSLSKEDVEKAVLANEQMIKFLDDKAAKKVIVVPGKIVNVVV